MGNYFFQNVLNNEDINLGATKTADVRLSLILILLSNKKYIYFCKTFFDLESFETHILGCIVKFYINSF